MAILFLLCIALAVINPILWKESKSADTRLGCLVVQNECPNENITFYLYNRFLQNDEPYMLDVKSEDSIKNANFVQKAPIKFLVHGYTGHKDYSPNMEIRPVYLQNSEMNVISVDYKNLALEPCYLEAVTNAPVVANCTAQLVDAILDLRHDIALDQFHIVGLSLGAQISGMIHRYFKHGQFTRITGLDPALPFFSNLQTSWKDILNKDSAKFVDIIHTNAGVKGKLSPVANVDFYANSGTFQPGCGYNTSCSHVRSAEYYAESILTKIGFWSQPCSNLLLYYFGECGVPTVNNLILMGEHVPYGAEGIYTFKTNDHAPFALGKTPYKVYDKKWIKASNVENVL